MSETLEEFDRLLIAAGYRKYPRSSMICPEATAFYQKRIDDDIGVKFFLDCYLYDHTHIKNVDIPIPIGVEFLTHFRSINAAYKMSEYAKDTFDLAATELLFLQLWQTGNFNYSKTWRE
jgi:hypothetical protein